MHEWCICNFSTDLVAYTLDSAAQHVSEHAMQKALEVVETASSDASA